MNMSPSCVCVFMCLCVSGLWPSWDAVCVKYEKYENRELSVLCPVSMLKTRYLDIYILISWWSRYHANWWQHTCADVLQFVVNFVSICLHLFENTFYFAECARLLRASEPSPACQWWTPTCWRTRHSSAAHRAPSTSSQTWAPASSPRWAAEIFLVPQLNIFNLLSAKYFFLMLVSC